MSVRKKIILTTVCSCVLPILAVYAGTQATPKAFPSTAIVPPEQLLAQQLGWVMSPENNCGGYYVDQPFVFPVEVTKNNSVAITSNQTLFAQHGTSILEGKVTATREGQQITANKAFLYRDTNGKLSSMELMGNVHLREPNTVVVGKTGHYDFASKAKSLKHIFYRTSFNGKEISGPNVTPQETHSARKITSLTAWGRAYEFSQTEPKIYELSKGSFSTCPPINPAWRVKASRLVLNKNTGRGYATNARLLVKNIPVFYTPYLNFSIDKQRKTGFLWPVIGGSSSWGPYFLAPFYWNMAPNYDMTITPGLLTKRGLQLSDNFRYLSHLGSGKLQLSVLPSDKLFSEQQTSSKEKYGTNTNPMIQAELNRLLNDSTTRKSVIWRDDSRFNEHWSSHIDFNYAGDDYYYRDFGNSLNEVTENQLLQEADLNYKGQNWNFIGRLQNYQTLHPIQEVTETPIQNQYRRLPQLLLNMDYPDQSYGFEYFMLTEATHFDIRNNPGVSTNMPIGDRYNVQPGISLPLSTAGAYLNPRIQLAMTQYNLYQTAGTVTPTNKRRVVPIFDVASGLTFERDTNLFSQFFQQTFEPQAYYTYIPYRNQASIPTFDTTVNTLTYDQLFNYNRFSGIDRIGDANQVGAGMTSRLIEQDTGIEKARLGIGEIMYFSTREVTLCNNQAICTDYPDNKSNLQRFSPVSGLLKYNVSPSWNLNANSLWNPTTRQVDSSSVTLQYKPNEQHIVNLGFSFVRNGDIFTGIATNTASNNLKLTDFSFAWPVVSDISAVGRWSEDWNTYRFQNILYGLQYDTCCWAVRFVGGRAFTNLSAQNTPQYNTTYYIQFALKGLGDMGAGSGNATSMLSSITGYNTKFGQET